MDNGSTGVNAIATCAACTAGYACPTGTGTDATGQIKMRCEPGHYCPSGTKDPREFPCPAGKYTELTDYGKSAVSDCKDCTAGHYCPAGSTFQKLCPPGYNCPANSGSPVACNSGTYRATQGATS